MREYQAWVWGRTWDEWNKVTNWWATALDGHTERCGYGADDPSGPDNNGSDNSGGDDE